MQKTWTQPEPNPKTDINSKAISENLEWWLQNGERGTSSETMVYYFTGRKINDRECHPLDPDDFKRCYLLLKAVPQFKREMHKLKLGGTVWSNLVDNWDKLESMLEKNIAEKWANYKEVGMYEFMKELGC